MIDIYHNSSAYVNKIVDLVEELMQNKNRYFVINIATEIINYTFTNIKNYYPKESRILSCYPACVTTLEAIVEKKVTFSDYKLLYEEYKLELEKYFAKQV